MMDTNVSGIYFHPQRREILAVQPATAPPEEPWIKFTDDFRLALLAARHELERLGLTSDAHGVEWSGMSAVDPEQRRRLSSLIRSFRNESVSLQREAESKREVLAAFGLVLQVAANKPRRGGLAPGRSRIVRAAGGFAV
jgi:hypothetical protein